jgi:hypothetical protein
MVDRKGFESLRVYRLSEELADAVWDVVSPWRILAKDTVGKQMIRAADSVGAKSRKVLAAGRTRTIESSSITREAHFMKLATGFDARSNVVSFQPHRSIASVP